MPFARIQGAFAKAGKAELKDDSAVFIFLFYYCDSNITGIYCSYLPLSPEKHPNDSFDYFSFVLPSGLKVLHIRHAELTINLATLDVNVGYLDRNIEKFGIAHLLEHVLCRTTVKDGAHKVDLKNLIEGTGGEFEAHTYPTHTNYYFHCQPSEFYHGFKHFANIFNTFSIQSSIIDQEIESVNNEIDMRINEPMIKNFHCFTKYSS